MVKNSLDFKAKMNIYLSLIHCHFIYGSIIWISSLNQKQLNSLKVVQKKALRIVYSKKYNAHTSKLFEKSRITKVENLFEKESLLLTFKFMNRELPNAVLELFDACLTTTSRLTRSMANKDLILESKLKKGNLMFDIIDNWNKAPTSMKEESNFYKFKKSITDKQNQYVACTVRNCYRCRYDN